MENNEPWCKALTALRCSRVATCVFPLSFKLTLSLKIMGSRLYWYLVAFSHCFPKPAFHFFSINESWKRSRKWSKAQHFDLHATLSGKNKGRTCPFFLHCFCFCSPSWVKKKKEPKSRFPALTQCRIWHKPNDYINQNGDKPGFFTQVVCFTPSLFHPTPHGRPLQLRHGRRQQRSRLQWVWRIPRRSTTDSIYSAGIPTAARGKQRYSPLGLSPAMHKWFDPHRFLENTPSIYDWQKYGTQSGRVSRVQD